jgi:hypothetical protein
MDTEKALDMVEALRDLCREFEFKVPAHAVGRDDAGIAMLAERPPREVVEALWLPMVDNANHRGLNVEYREVEEKDVVFACLYIRLPAQVREGVTIFGDSLNFWYMACENMLWTHMPNMGGASGIAFKGIDDD